MFKCRQSCLHSHVLFAKGGIVRVHRRLTGGDLVFSVPKVNQSETKQLVETCACQKC